MAQVKFVRSTHEGVRFHPFSTEAYQFWRDHGWVVGEVLRPEQGMTFSEIVSASREYLLDHPESEMLLPVREAYLAWCLIKLLEYGMAGVVAEPISPTKAV
jgi:hypothetical protein